MRRRVLSALARHPGQGARPLTRRILLAVLALAVIAIAVVGLATAGAPRKAPSRSASPLVSIGQPVTPRRVGRRPNDGWIEMRVSDPDGGRPRVVVHHTFRKVRRGRDLLHVCADVPYEGGPYIIRPWGNCVTPEDPASMPPVMLSSGYGTHLPVTVAGQVNKDVVRLVLSGPGGTYEVPLTRHGAFVVLYKHKTRGKATLTAHLRDGSTRFQTFELPPGETAPGASEARDPGGLPAWTVRAAPRGSRTCAELAQRYDVDARRRRAGGERPAPLCGDLQRAPVFADATVYGPRPVVADYGPGPRSPRRLIVWGAVAPSVRAVTVRGPGGPRPLPLSDVGRAFVTVYPARVKPADVTVEARLTDGRLLRHPAPRLLNSERPPPAPRLADLHVTFRPSRTDPAKLVIVASLTQPAKSFAMRMQRRRVRMHKSGHYLNYRQRYVGVTRRGARRFTPGRLYRMTALICGHGGCGSTFLRARLAAQ